MGVGGFEASHPLLSRVSTANSGSCKGEIQDCRRDKAVLDEGNNEAESLPFRRFLN